MNNTNHKSDVRLNFRNKLWYNNKIINLSLNFINKNRKSKSMKSDFINEKEFLDEMNYQWTEFNNTPSDKFNQTWKTILKAFNLQIQGVKGLHVCDSVCGSGKTLSMEVASALLCKNWDIGTLIVVRLTDQCLDISQRINAISERLYGRSIAKAFFSGKQDGVRGQLTEGEQMDAQVLVVTHSRYLSSVSGRGSSFFKKWKNGHRKFRVVDESLDLVERFHLTRPELIALDGAMKLRKDYFTDFYEKFSSHLSLFNDINMFLGTKVRKIGKYSKQFIQLIDKYKVDGNEIYFTEMSEFFESSTPKDYEGKKWKDGEFESFIEESIQSLGTLDRLIRRSLYYGEDEGKGQYSTGQIILPNDFESLCVLDATSNVDEVYKLFKKGTQYTPYPTDRSVRTFRNCTIHIRPERSGLGIGASKKQVIPRVTKITKWATETFDRSDKVLFAGHKILMKHLSKVIEGSDVDFQYDFCWWNAIDGKNEWKDYNKLVVLSLNYLPNNYDSVTAIGFEDINPDMDESNPCISNSSMAVKLIQLLARIRTRRVINKQGDCPESDVYLLLPSNDILHPDDEVDRRFDEMLDSLGSYVLKEIKSSMNGVKISNWLSFGGFHNGNIQGKLSIQDKFIFWIKSMKPGEVREKSEFERNITEKERMSLKSSFVPSSKIARQLRSLNIHSNTTRGRYGKTTFTKLEATL